MAKEVYGLRIRPEKVTLFEEIVKTDTSIEEIFGKDWIEKNISAHYDDKTKMHPIFWVILKDRNFSSKLILLEKSYDKFKSLINSLKNDFANLNNIISNINVFYDYKIKLSDVFFQPPIPNKERECDIKVILGGIEYWGEILTINLSEEDKAQDDIDNYIRIQYNENNITNNCVYLEYHDFIDENQKNVFIDFLSNESKKLDLKKGEECVREFVVNNKVICEAKFFGKGETFKKGYYGGSMSPGQFMKDDIRVKNKILDKLDSFQFPEVDNIHRFFVMLLKSSVDIIDVDNAIFGQECVIFSTNGKNFKESRNRNGIIHDPARSKFFDKIDFILIKDDDKKYYRVNNKSSLTLDFIKATF